MSKSDFQTARLPGGLYDTCARQFRVNFICDQMKDKTAAQTQFSNGQLYRLNIYEMRFVTYWLLSTFHF